MAFSWNSKGNGEDGENENQLWKCNRWLVSSAWSTKKSILFLTYCLEHFDFEFFFWDFLDDCLKTFEKLLMISTETQDPFILSQNNTYAYSNQIQNESKDHFCKFKGEESKNKFKWLFNFQIWSIFSYSHFLLFYIRIALITLTCTLKN